MKEKHMGFIYADIEIINTLDLGMAQRGFIGNNEIKKMHVSILVDTGSYMLAINERMQEYLQIPVVDKRKARLANDESTMCNIVGPVDIRFKNRSTTCRAMVLPGNSEPLLGSIPLEDLDVVINPLKQELTVNPDSPDMATTILKELTTVS
jgi:clan AA aspartic protease